MIEAYSDHCIYLIKQIKCSVLSSINCIYSLRGNFRMTDIYIIAFGLAM